MFNPSKDQVRLFFIDAWSKALQRSILTPAETIAVQWIEQHPEYHSMLESKEKALEQEFTPEQGDSNPFLHLSMHLAVAEQVSINQPPGILPAYQRLCEQYGNEHDAAHRVFECLAEQIWQQQRNGVSFDSASYLKCLAQDLSMPGLAK